jgi:hypothetical protein
MMGRTHWHAPLCKLCGKPNHDGGRVSATGLCYDCGKSRMNENNEAMVSKRGRFAQWWAFRMAASVGWAPLDGGPKQP